jgi:hypothetical protein
MMTILTTLKKYYASIITNRGRDAGPRSAGKKWQIILVGFGIIEAIFLVLVVYISYRLEERQSAIALPSQTRGGASPTIDRERLQGLLDQFERKAVTHEALRLAAPNRVDPSVRSWYGENDKAQ